MQVHCHQAHSRLHSCSLGRAPFHSLASSSRPVQQQNQLSRCLGQNLKVELGLRRIANMRSTGVARSRSAGLIVRANWGADVKFSSAKVVANTKVIDNMHVLMVDVGVELAAGYTKPGQYMQIKVGDSKAGFFAIASPPDANNAGVLEFLIKVQPGATAELLCAQAPGAEVSVSPAMGKGFPVEKIPAGEFPTVLLFATGSGISPVKALIESGTLEINKRKDVHLYYGTRNKGLTAYQDSIPQWESAGVKVTQVFSSEHKQYVQDVFAQSKMAGNGQGVAAVLCGQKGMAEAIKAMLLEGGVDADKILLNF